MTAEVVIGCRYGDEGKGLMTDYFTHRAVQSGKKTCTVFAAGAAQRGHTVVTPEGQTHVFRHIGSGTFAGADTYIAENFIVSPMIFREEWEELEKMGIHPTVYVNPSCIITTPYDVYINQTAETMRGGDRHGSCGCGVWETIERNHKSDEPLTLQKLREFSRSTYFLYMKAIRELYLPRRIKEYDMTIPEKDSIFLSDWGADIDEVFMDDVNFFLDHIKLAEDDILTRYDHLVLENGQGLGLDPDYAEDKRHATPCSTGLKEPARLLAELETKTGSEIQTEVCYVMRTYETRHGAGPMWKECSRENMGIPADQTNVDNPWQGSLRYGELPFVDCAMKVYRDYFLHKSAHMSKSFAVTHTDEKCIPHWFSELVTDGCYSSRGRTRNDIND